MLLSLRDTDISLSHLTRELGYAEQSVLSRLALLKHC